MALRFSPARGAASFALSSAIRGPTGAAATVAVGLTTTLAPGSPATVTNSGSTAAAVLNFGIPEGADGITPTVAVGSTSTLSPGASATVTNVGTPQDLVLNFGIPRGADGTVAGPGSSIDNEIALWNGTGGASLKRATITGLLKATSGVLSAAASGTDYAPATSGSALLKGNGSGGFSAAVAGTDYQAADAQLFSNIPQNSQSAAYTLVATDAQKHIFHPVGDNNARTFTIPANVSIPFPTGTAITFINKINVVTIAITSDTLTLAGAGTTGSRSLAANGVATAIKITSTEWIISGTGLT